ncbi:MAG: dihydropteroate synthase [bacterium]|nr:dihydropteroate synthase [bacterium]
MKMKIGNKIFDFSRTYIMGIINMTPDSFSDGGSYADIDSALKRIECLIREGADIIDIGAESSRPDSQGITAKEETGRLDKILKRYKRYFSTPLSLDTVKSEVAEFGLSSGVDMINDISSFKFDDKMPSVISKYQVPVVLMHMQGTPATMQDKPQYKDIMSEIYSELAAYIKIAEDRGISDIIIDPGIGFGKTLADNLAVLNNIDHLKGLKKPVMAGTSRKSFIGRLTGSDTMERLEGTISSNIIAVLKGASFVRVHDVGAVNKALKVADAILRCEK